MKRILVVDDEAAIRDLIRAILQDEGYCVDAAGSVEDAVQMYTEKVHDMVITDMMLSTGSGKQVISAVNRHKTKLLAMSGYTEEHITCPILWKPFKMQRLIDMVKESLC
jgi:DNA-binding NtrC family response regulator